MNLARLCSPDPFRRRRLIESGPTGEFCRLPVGVLHQHELGRTAELIFVVSLNLARAGRTKPE